MFVNDLFENKKTTEGSVQDRLHRRHQELRKKSGLPDPDYYKELKASYDIENDQKRLAQQAEIKKKYKVAEQDAYANYALNRAKGDMLQKEINPDSPQQNVYVSPSYNKMVSDLTTNLDYKNPDFAKKRAVIGPSKQTQTDAQLAAQLESVKQDVTESSDHRQWSNKEKETFRRNVAGLDDMFGKDDAWTKTKQRQIKHQIKTKPMAGPKGQLPEQQGVAEGVEQYLEEMRRAGYDIVTERATLCPECGGVAYEDKMLAEKQDACYHKVKSRYKVWPSAYASGALVRCRKVGAKNWGNKSKK